MSKLITKFAAHRVGLTDHGTRIYSHDDEVTFFDNRAAADDWVRNRCARDTTAIYAVFEVVSVVKAKPVEVVSAI